MSKCTNNSLFSVLPILLGYQRSSIIFSIKESLMKYFVSIMDEQTSSLYAYKI